MGKMKACFRYMEIVMISGKQGGIHESTSDNELSFLNRRIFDSLKKF